MLAEIAAAGRYTAAVLGGTVQGTTGTPFGFGPKPVKKNLYFS